MKTPRELLIEKYRHREPDLHVVASRLSRQWKHSDTAEASDRYGLLGLLVDLICWRRYWCGLGAVWIFIGLLHTVTIYQSATPTQNQNVEWSGDLDLILRHYAAAHQDELEWMDELDFVPHSPVEQQETLSDNVPGPQGGLNLRSRKGSASSWAPMTIKKRERHLECGGSTPLWIRQGYSTRPPSTCNDPLPEISKFDYASKQSGGVGVTIWVFSMFLGCADRIQSGVEPPHSKWPLPYVSGIGIVEMCLCVTTFLF